MAMSVKIHDSCLDRIALVSHFSATTLCKLEFQVLLRKMRYYSDNVCIGSDMLVKIYLVLFLHYSLITRPTN
jgi:hypothetical protein